MLRIISTISGQSIAKAGIAGASKTIAKEWGPFGVRANTVSCKRGRFFQIHVYGMLTNITQSDTSRRV
jgi:NAD(P)-dependent dehydrogenase (short-subunit alcohol dehydrogenase family)